MSSGYFEVNTAGLRAAGTQLLATARRVDSLTPLPLAYGCGEFHDVLNAVEDFTADWAPRLEQLRGDVDYLGNFCNTAAGMYDEGDAQQAAAWWQLNAALPAPGQFGPGSLFGQ